MRELSIKDIVKFREKSDRAKKTFVANLKLDKEKVSSESGGDYWVICLSAISKSYKLNNKSFIIEKREEVEEKWDKEDYQRTKTMYKRNIDILYKCEDFDFRSLRPEEPHYLKKQKVDSVLLIKGFELKVTPSHLFVFKNSSDEEEIGAIWFVAQLDGFRKDDLGMFTEILYRYLRIHYSKQYIVNPNYCIAFDVYNTFSISYSEFATNSIEKILFKTLSEIEKLI